MIRKNNEIIVRVRIPRIHQFFHLEDKPESAFLRISGVLSEDGGISGISESALESKSPYLSSISVSLSLVLSVSWSPPAASPSRGGGATAPPGPGQPPRCLSSNIIRSSAAAAASSNAPKPEPHAGSRRRPRTGRSAEPLTPRQHGAAAAAAPGHPQNGNNERALEAASSERGAGGGAASGCGAGSGRLARAEQAGTRRSAAAGCQVRACTQRPQVGGAQGRGAREGA